MKKSTFSLLSVLFLLCLISKTMFANEISTLIIHFKEDQSALSRKYTNQFSQDYFERMGGLYLSYEEKLNQFDYHQLSLDEQTDFHLFQYHLGKQKHQNQSSFERYQRIAYCIPMESELQSFVVSRQRAAKPDPIKLAKVFQSAEKIILQRIHGKASIDRFQSWQDASFAASSIAALRSSVEEAYQFYYDYDPQFTWWVQQPWSDLKDQLSAYEAFIREHYDTSVVKDDGSGIVGQPIGRQALERALRLEMIAYSADELIAEANRQYAWCLQEMKKASVELGFGDNWKKALEHVKDQYAPPGEWPSKIVEMAEEAIGFLTERDLITIPELAKETWRTKMLSAEAQRVSPFFLGGEAILIAYPTSTMTHEEKMMSMRGNNPHFARAVVHHELIPGHHLQQFMNRRYQTHRSGLGSIFWIEGWALYWEFNLWNHGFAVTPEDRIGMLFWKMHRAARIIFSLNFHMEQMTPQECIDFLVDQVGHERANAEAEVRRSFTGGYGPLYQIAYMVGGLQLSALKEEFVASGIMTEKAFHDFIITQNNLPITILRERMKDKPIQKTLPRWRFLGDGRQ